MATSSPVVVSRENWGAVKPKKRVSLKGPVKKVVIHHTAFPSKRLLEDVQAQVFGIQRHHMNERDFDDIGYNFLVGEDGTVFEGRGWCVVGAHTKGHNDDSLGVAFMGNFNDVEPSQAALQAVKNLLQEGVSHGYLDSTFVVTGHKDLGETECPGTNLYAALPQLTSTSLSLQLCSAFMNL